MKELICAFALSLLFCLHVPLRAQVAPTHPTNPNAVFLGSTQVTIGLQTGDPNYETKGAAEFWIFDVKTGGSTIDYVVNLASVRFYGNDSIINGLSTISIFDMFGKGVVAKGIFSGYTPCLPSCPGSDTVHVVQESCVHRLGSGVNTTFTACSPLDYCSRSYIYCCPSGPSSPQITQIVTGTHVVCSPDANGVCQPTCP